MKILSDYEHLDFYKDTENDYIKVHKRFLLFVSFQNFTQQPFNVTLINHLNAELNPICYLLALLGAHHFLHVSRIRVTSLNLRLLMSYIYVAPILDVSRSHTTTQHSR